MAAEGIRLGLIGIGKIARDQHLPAIAADDRFVLAATASPHATLEDIPGYGDVRAMLAGGHDLDAVSLCTPPKGRFEQAEAAIEAGLHVMLEKPPAAAVSAVAALADRARAKGVTLFAAWHSREAAGVEPAKAWLTDKTVLRVTITWREDIRRWHPGQEWILGPGGFGVFDPGINALSIVTKILPEPVRLESAWIETPEGRASPLRARLAMRCGSAPVTAEFDFLQTGPQTWDTRVETDAGALTLAMGGDVLTLPGEAERRDADREYPRLYARFADLIAAGESDVDWRPLQLVADAFLVAERATGARFEF